MNSERNGDIDISKLFQGKLTQVPITEGRAGSGLLSKVLWLSLLPAPHVPQCLSLLSVSFHLFFLFLHVYACDSKEKANDLPHPLILFFLDKMISFYFSFILVLTYILQ